MVSPRHPFRWKLPVAVLFAGAVLTLAIQFWVAKQNADDRARQPLRDIADRKLAEFKRLEGELWQVRDEIRDEYPNGELIWEQLKIRWEVLGMYEREYLRARDDAQR